MIFSGVNLSHCTFSRREISHCDIDDSSFELANIRFQIVRGSVTISANSTLQLGQAAFSYSIPYHVISRDPVVNKLDTSSGLSGSLRDAKKTFRNKK